MNLTTHWILAFALGIAFTHNTEIALIMSIGALIPDLDREYVFVARDFIGRHQLHRSLFHNVFVIGGLYLLNPYLALGALSHTLLDSFTTATDRGVELFFPITRLVNGHYYDIEGNPTKNFGKMTWWVEDTWRLLKTTSDKELQEPDDQPWRRSYGPFKNGRIVDWGIFFTSLFFLLLAYIVFRGSFFSSDRFRWPSVYSIVGIAIFYGVGEWYRRKVATRLMVIKAARAAMVATNLKPLEGSGVVSAGLLLGMSIFIISGLLGGVFLLSPLTLPDLFTFFISIGSIAVGFVAAWILVRVWKTDDVV